MAEKFVVEGDVTKVPTQALATLINSAGAWFGGVDSAINRVAGQKYHNQISAANGRLKGRDGEAFIATGSRNDHQGSFDNVIFVIDDFQLPLSDLVYSALMAAKNAGYMSIALPLMRTGVAMGQVEKNTDEVVNQMKLGIERAEHDGVDMTIYVVVYQSPNAVSLLSRFMQKL